VSSTTKLFTDRTEAGRALATRMAEYAAPDLVVLGLPRGGVVVAAEVARALRGTLDVVVVRKIGVPWQPELALGAIAAVDEDVETVREERVLGRLQVDEETFERARERESRRAAPPGGRLPAGSPGSPTGRAPGDRGRRRLRHRVRHASWRTSFTPPMKWGKSSNWVHWS
jgi:putative phosphoribosyl transferase